MTFGRCIVRGLPPSLSVVKPREEPVPGRSRRAVSMLQPECRQVCPESRVWEAVVLQQSLKQGVVEVDQQEEVQSDNLGLVLLDSVECRIDECGLLSV